jgi:pimeloyl-ACP methyl ester carboxylesterase
VADRAEGIEQLGWTVDLEVGVDDEDGCGEHVGSVRADVNQAGVVVDGFDGYGRGQPLHQVGGRFVHEHPGAIVTERGIDTFGDVGGEVLLRRLAGCEARSSGGARAVVFGSCGSGPTAIALAARAPESVSGLVLFGTCARMLATADYPAGWSREFFEQYKAALEQGWTTGRGIRRSVPSAGPDERLMEWLGRLLRLSATPATARAILDFGSTLDVRELLDRIAAPTLVLHRRDDQWVHPDNGRLAAHIPGARFVELEGADHWPWFGDAESVLRPVEDFLDGLRPRHRGFSEGRRATLVP